MKYSYSIPNHGSSWAASFITSAANVLKLPLAGVFLSLLKFSHKTKKLFPFLNGSLNKAAGLSQISESSVGAYPVEEPS